MQKTFKVSELEAGQALPDLDFETTATVVAGGALASRDYTPVHHDKAAAVAQGLPDMFMNILTTQGICSRYVTDWAGPEAILRSISIRLGASAVPGKPLRFSGQVASDEVDGDERVLGVAVRAANDLGDHVTGTVVLTLPV